MSRPITIPVGGSMQLGIDRLGMRRRLTAALLRHGPDGVWGACYCGSGYDSDHRRREVAAETGLDPVYVAEVLDEHSSAVGHFGGEMRCRCRVTYVDRNYGADQHLAEAVAAGCTVDMLRAANRRRREQRAGGAR